MSGELAADRRAAAKIGSADKPSPAPQLSIVIPAYNSDRYLGRAIDSVLQQTYRDWEAIVVDDGSTDGTLAVLKDYRERVGDRLRFFSQENQGSAAARNAGWKAARGEFIAFLDADDWFVDPEKLADQMALLSENDAIDCVHAGWIRTDDRGKELARITPWETAPNLDTLDWLRWKPIRLSAIVIRRSWLERVGGFDETLRQSHDVDLMLRLSQAGCRSVWLKKIAVAYCQHDANTTRNSQVQAECVERWLDKFFHQRQLSDELRELEPEIRYNTYVWLAWYHYRADRLDLAIDALRKSLTYANCLRVEVPGDWVSAFARHAAAAGLEFDADALTDQPEWQRFVAMTLPVRPRLIAYLKAEARDRGIESEPDTFVLLRILGNDLPPRHKIGQTLENLRFILDNEPPIEHCEKHWIVNRIVDREQEERTIALLEERNRPYIRIPFDLEEYARVDLNFDGFPHPGFFLSKELDRRNETTKSRVLDTLYHDKNRYVINNNGARNVALRAGKKLAKWTLPWDGNCFVTPKSWEQILAAVTERGYYKYFIVPMTRCLDNQQLLDPAFQPNPVEEPQVIFRRDSLEEFNEQMRYGRRPKVELLWRLRVPGIWDRWKYDFWERQTWTESPEAYCYDRAGWVARLFSGSKNLEIATIQALKGRGNARSQAVNALFDRLDECVLRRTFDRDRCCIFDESTLEARRKGWVSGSEATNPAIATLLATAARALGDAPYSVTQKTTLPPSQDPHDYWHPAPYWWPDPTQPDGLPYVKADGKRIPGTVLYEPESDRYDRTRLQLLFDNTTALALAWFFSGESRYAEKACEFVRAWFLDPETRMNPNLNYSQVRMGHNENRGSKSGLIETKDFYFFLDAVRLLERSKIFSEDDRASLSAWLAEFLQWLLDSEQGQREKRSQNNHGTCYDLQVAAIAAYLDDAAVLSDTLWRSKIRLFQQIEPDGRQPEELTRTTTFHYCTFNLQSWANLARLAQSAGVDLWHYCLAEDGRGLEKAFAWLLPYFARPWPYEQIDDFDRDRLVPLYFAARDRYSELAEAFASDYPALSETKSVFFPHDGIPPHWPLYSHS